MKKFHIDRLEKLHAFLGTVKPEKFDLSSWGTNYGQDTEKTPNLNFCGTTACALGWAASMPAFRKRGLKLVWDEFYNEDADVVLTGSDGEEYNGERAGAIFFGLTDYEAYELFIPDDNEGRPDDMSLGEYRKHLRKFINRKKRELNIK